MLWCVISLADIVIYIAAWAYTYLINIVLSLCLTVKYITASMIYLSSYIYCLNAVFIIKIYMQYTVLCCIVLNSIVLRMFGNYQVLMEEAFL